MGRSLGKKKSTEMPFIVKVFKRHLRNWSLAAGVLYAEPMNSIFQHIVFTSQRMALFETKWHIIAIYEYVGSDEMNDEAKKLYRKLKGMECELEMRILKKMPFFKPHKNLNDLKVYIPNLNISDYISQNLNKNQKVKKLLRSVDPLEAYITLLSLSPEHQTLSESQGDKIQSMVNFFDNPSSVTWIVTLTVMLPRFFGLQKKADDIFSLLNNICRVLKQETEKIEKELLLEYDR